MIFYEGTSQLDGRPIVGIMTGHRKPSSNPKTGFMAQTWIIRQDIHPSTAIKSGEDYSICGDCVHRRDPATGKRTCYVNQMGPAAVYRTYKAGKYKNLSPRSLTYARSLRVGAYGDPAMIPLDVWQSLLSRFDRWTGYTHQWQWCDPAYAKFCMASVESDEDQRLAEDLGYRCFRVRSCHDKHDGFITCPASEEAGKRTTCERCTLCAGNFDHKSGRPPHIQITVHGVGASSFQEGASHRTITHRVVQA